MWGEPGHLYVYLSHGIHSCVNVVCGPEGVAGGILLRAGEIVEGRMPRRGAARRRGATRRDLARGPGRLGDAVGLRHPVHDGIDAVSGAERPARSRGCCCAPSPRPDSRPGRASGVAGVGGDGCLPVALLDRRRSDGLGVPLGPRRRSATRARDRAEPASAQARHRGEAARSSRMRFS